jgi:diguanylate cyclase (GGDEF)-like protein
MDPKKIEALELEESHRNIRAIGEIGQRIANSPDAGTILNTVYEGVAGLMDAGIFAIGLFDDAMDIVDYRLLMEEGRRLPLFQVSAEDANSFAARVVASGREIMLGDAADHFTENVAMPGSGAMGKWPNSIICCPLSLSDRIMGVIAVQSHAAYAYSERNLETIRALACYITIALNNAQQSEELEARAKDLELASRTDVLTGLNNRRHAMEKINEECVRFQRSGRPFSIIICDIDYFKKVNDSYGHDCGDAALKALAGLLGRHIRKQDCLARWGGEEFLLLLPETNAAGAAMLAEKLRRRVEEFEFTYAGAKLPFTMTFGVAEFIRDYGVDACIVGADSALYKGKSDGRNRVVIF